MATRSLGTLTLDLIAKVGGFTAGMDKADRSAEKWRKQVEKSAAAAGKAIGAASVLAFGAGAVWIKSTVETANEIAKLAQVSNASTTEFQKAAYAAQTVGIEQDKLADIYKDVNDRVGEFLETGGGPMLDFFKNIAPYVGVAADEFRNLSGPQALGLYVQSLEKAGLSQQEMTFYMEAMASDTTALIPLLRDGGKGMADMAAQADTLGIVLDDKTIKAAQQFNRDLDTFGKIAGGVGQKVAAELLPELTQLTALLKDPSTAEAASKLAKAIVTITSGTIEAVKGTVDFMGWMGDSIAASVTGPALDDIIRIEDRLDKLKSHAALFEKGGQAVPPSILAEIDELNAKRKLAIELQEQQAVAAAAAQKAAEAQAAADKKAAEQEAANEEEARRRREKQRKLDEAAAEAKKEAERLAKEAERKAKQAADEAIAAAKRRAEAIAEVITNLEYQVKTLGMSADQEQLYKLSTEGATQAQLEHAAALLETVTAYEKNAKAAEDAKSKQDRINESAASVIEGLRTREEAVKDSYDRQRKLILDATNVTEEQRADALLRLQQKTDDELLEANAGYWEKWLAAAQENLTSFNELAGTVIEDFTGQFGDAFESMVFDAESLEDAVGGMAEGMARSVVNAVGQMVAQWIALQAVQLMTGKTTQASAAATLSANAQATALQAGLAAFASTAAIPIVGPPAAPAAMTAALAVAEPMAAAIGAISLAGMAHDGIDSVPQTGTWLLQKGERVTTAETSAKLDRTLDRVQSGISSTSNDNRSSSNINVTVAFPDGSPTREQRSSGAQIGRQIARIVDSSQRYT
ncbi:hypothetical protein [Pseudomonas jinjuensis]|uniref:Phage tail tape measure protein, lambda family n=1 Tax=Pseudomonas jinjuensis TaxID=198616 RepID=A0A1H0JT13_9PSED|nr:hypothetical protein [Pseudomonas jinjuensis]SDO46689.1 hypothetical protein SAMN05216193_111190 [Pseudomonas jinjuensis]